MRVLNMRTYLGCNNILKMKKKTILFAFLVVALQSCQTIMEETTPTIIESDTCSEEIITIKATLDNPTKTVLDNDMATVLWKPSETIMVFSNGASAVFTSTNDSNTDTAEFEGSISVGEDIFGVYPSTGASFSDGHINTSLSGAQVAQSGSFSDKLLITAGHSKDLNLRFYNVCSGLRFTLEQEGIRAVTLKSLDETPMAGDISIVFGDDGKPVISNISNPKTEITVFAPDYGEFEPGKWYYIVTLPGTFDAGIAFYFFDGYRQGSRVIDGRSFTFKRSIFKQTQNLDNSVELIECSPAPDEIWYVNRDCEAANIFFNGITMQSNTYENGIGVFKASSNFTTIRGGLSSRLLHVVFPEGATEIGELYNDNGAIQTAVVPQSVTRLGSYAFQHFDGNIIFKGNAPSFDIISDDEGDDYYACFGYNAKLLVRPENYRSFLYRMPNDYMKNVQLLHPIPHNEILYKTNDDSILELSSFAGGAIKCFGANILSNSVENGWGRIIFDNDIHSIGSNAFTGSTNLERVFLPNSITEIKTSAFNTCSSLSTVYLPKDLEIIGGAVFQSCSSLQRIVIPQNAVFLDDNYYPRTEINPFNSCQNLQYYYYKSKWTNVIIQNNILISVAPTTTFLNVTCNKVGVGAAANNSVNTLWISSSCTAIGNNAFLNCNNLTTVTIPAECTIIGAYAFSSCLGLQSIRIQRTTPPSGGEYMFYNTHNCPIYVPASSVDAYKSAMFWSDYADRIQAMP